MISYPIFKSCQNLIAFTTEKADGFSDFSRFTGDDPEIFIRNRQLLASKFGISENQLVFPRQTHSDHIAVIREIPSKQLYDTDGLLSDQSGICLCVQTADCVPVLLFDPVCRIAGVVHAGWRGTVKGIAGRAIQLMKQHFGSNPENILAAIGPSISPEVYEVGGDVISEFRQNCSFIESYISQLPNGKWLLDLWELNKHNLKGSGLLPENIQILERCSFLEQDTFYSARRDGQQTGRIVSGIFMKSND
jgi:polyphenol oxidase